VYDSASVVASASEPGLRERRPVPAPPARADLASVATVLVLLLGLGLRLWRPDLAQINFDESNVASLIGDWKYRGLFPLVGTVSSYGFRAAPGWPFGMLATERMQVPRSDGPTAVRRVAMVIRRGDVNPATFEHEWDTVHPRFVAPLSGLRGYLQSVRVGCLPGVSAPDGSSTLWWDSVEVCEATYADTGPIGQAHVAEIAVYRVYTDVQPLEAMRPRN